VSRRDDSKRYYEKHKKRILQEARDRYANMTPEEKARLSERSKEKYRKNPEYRARIVAQATDRYYDNREKILSGRDKEASSQYGRDYRVKNRDAMLTIRREIEATDECKLKRHAQYIVIKALKLGELVRPDVCEDCATRCSVEVYHDSYDEDKLVDVRWLCRSCARSRALLKPHR